MLTFAFICFAAAAAEAGEAPMGDGAVPRTSGLPSVYVYPMPPHFNVGALAALLDSPSEWWHPEPSMLENYGFGPRLADGLFGTFQFGLEHALHQRLLHHYPNRALTAEAADLLYVPYYATIVATAFRDDRARSVATEVAAIEWLRTHAPRFAAEPHRHVFALGKTAIEHLGSLYGSAWLARPALRGAHALAIEAEPGWAVTCSYELHVKRFFANELLTRIAHGEPELLREYDHEHLLALLTDPHAEAASADLCLMRSAGVVASEAAARVWGVPYMAAYAYEPAVGEGGPAADAAFPWLGAHPRPLLAAFVGAERRPHAGIYKLQRVAAVRSCAQWADGAAHGSSAGACVVEADTSRRNVRALYSRAAFCLQPPGDTATRSGLFDSMLHGCIPVLWNASALEGQYPFHVRTAADVALVVPSEHQADALPWLARVRRDEPARLERMRSAIRELAPRLQYSVRGGRPADAPASGPWDALEHALVGLAEHAAASEAARFGSATLAQAAAQLRTEL